MGVPHEALVAWSRAQFALTAMYHWLFVPLTLGLGWIVAIMHTIYYKTGSEEWKKITKFWMKLFGINFAIGVATGIILEFEFGTNWSNYSWFVGDIFGAPLAIEGILAFFMESTFIAVMFFGWNRVSKGFHLASTWLTALGSNLSAVWILVANAWMQHPAGFHFDPDMARNEMTNFWAVALNPTAITKFLHAISQASMLASIFVMGVSAWYILKGRELRFAKKSMLVGATFGLLAGVWLIYTADMNAYDVGKTQPMKFAAFEGLYKGGNGVPSVVFGAVNPDKKPGDNQPEYFWVIKIPKLLSILATRHVNGYVPGIEQVLYGDPKHPELEPVTVKIQRGRKALQALAAYKQAKAEHNAQAAAEARKVLMANVNDMGYGYLSKPEEAIPDIGVIFYTFHLMVLIGFWLPLVALMMFIFALRDTLEKHRFWLKAALWSILLAYLASQFGWITAEMGRQPWAITGLLPVKVATSHISVGNVKTTFFIFAIIFTLLLIAEVSIMVNQIKKGPKIEEN